MLSIAIVDDDKDLCSLINDEINRMPIFDSLDYRTYQFNNGEHFLLSCNSNSFNIVLLDIDMPGINGLEVSELLRERNSKAIIIFITSKIEYMKDAFGLNIFGFISKKDFKTTLPNILKKSIEHIETNSSVLFKTNNGVIRLLKNDIIYATFDDRKVLLHTIEGNFYVNLVSLNIFYDMVSSSKSFIYINRGTIINMVYLISTANKEVQLKGIKEKLPISKDKLKDINMYLIDWISTKGII